MSIRRKFDFACRETGKGGPVESKQSPLPLFLVGSEIKVALEYRRCCRKFFFKL
jgi:hypothetical protein